MGYRLSTLSGKGSGWNVIADPSPEEIERAIDELLPLKDFFVILTSEYKLNEFIQTRATDKGVETEIEYVIEIHFEYGSKLGEVFKHYQKYTTDIVELKKMFRMFALGELPDITGWKDITAEMIADREKKKKFALEVIPDVSEWTDVTEEYRSCKESQKS
jgi:hypothetical protein